MKRIMTLALLFLVLKSYSQYDSNYIRMKLFKDNTRFIGTKFGTFDVTALNGQHYSNKRFKNKITFINFWFSACVPCVNEFEELKKLYENYTKNKKFQFLSFTFDPVNVATKTRDAFYLPYPILVLPDSQCTILSFGKGYPTNMIIDEMGRVVRIIPHRSTPDETKHLEKNAYPILDSLLVQKIIRD